MKKLPLISTILSYQLFAVECTQEQYSPYFTDKKNERYLFASEFVVNYSLIVFDKTSVKYDNKNIIKVWIIFQGKSHSKYDIIKSFMEFNIKDNTYRFYSFLLIVVKESYWKVKMLMFLRNKLHQIVLKKKYLIV